MVFGWDAAAGMGMEQTISAFRPVQQFGKAQPLAGASSLTSGTCVIGKIAEPMLRVGVEIVVASTRLLRALQKITARTLQ